MSCTYRNSFLESEQFYAISLHILSVIQVPLHIFGTFIIATKTPAYMKRVKITMLVVHLTFAWLDIYMTILSMPIFLIPMVSGYPLGLLYYLGVPVRFMTYLGYLSVFLTIPAMIMFFENRYNYLVRKDHMTRGRKIKRLLYFSLLYILSVITFIPPVIDNPNRVEVLEASHRKFPCLPPEIIDNPRLFVMGTDNNTFIACVVPYIIIGWVQILGFFVGTVNFIYRTKTMSLHTSNLQKKFFKSLCIQIAVPLVVLLIPESYILNTAISGNMDVGLTNILMIWMASHGLFSTVVMLIVHKPYRKATLSILGRPQAIKTAPVSIISKLFTR
ncbi:Serpentine Receptor, class H [Caenorhabditis elegans]|uniref:Serpentine Receptor, class H n=1 Tax=Caenorhabditis elegans TaxID=6239 RepID=O18071_CAEEL|nr:Serpentine Receptor, class H [Caenorhabditis elegans]CAB05794.1 Serpentine Receptor, class H [Caenorhabditis elegans]|eukprot:NP_507163.1 Serpentine Receptor, class H [Caenorhabditis elegans]